jgi:hypothetical protein
MRLCTSDLAYSVAYVRWSYHKSVHPSEFQVTRSLGDLPVLFALMRVVRSLLHNPHIHIEPYVSGRP